MKNTISLVIFALSTCLSIAFLSIVASAKPEPTLTPQLKVFPPCDLNADDPFAIEAVKKTSPWKGHCVNTNRYRSAIRLTPAQRLDFFRPDELAVLEQQGLNVNDSSVEVIGNFAATDKDSNEHFYVAVVPLERINDSVAELTPLKTMKLPVPIFVPFPFPPHFITQYELIHGQIMLRLTDTGRPVILVDQTKQIGTREMKTLNDSIVMTVSGVRPVDHEEKYDPVKGLKPGYYGEEFQIGSQQNLDINWITPLGYHTQLYKLNFTAEQSVTAFKAGLTWATTHNVTTPYSTLGTSCLNFIFMIFHDVIDANQTNLLVKLTNMLPHFIKDPIQSIDPKDILNYLGLTNSDGSSYLGTLP